MNLSTLYANYQSRFTDATDDINWKEVAKALDESDYMLAVRILRRPLEAAAESVTDELPREDHEDRGYQERATWEIYYTGLPK